MNEATMVFNCHCYIFRLKGLSFNSVFQAVIASPRVGDTSCNGDGKEGNTISEKVSENDALLGMRGVE